VSDTAYGIENGVLYSWRIWVAMNEENRLLVTNELVELRTSPDRFRGVCGMYFKLMKKIERSQHVTNWTCEHKAFDIYILPENPPWTLLGGDYKRNIVVIFAWVFGGKRCHVSGTSFCILWI
jgi:hypothetical protein